MTTSPSDDEHAGRANAQGPSSSSAGDPAGFPGWTQEGGPPLHPLMQHPTASVAAAAAMGFGMASHFAGFMLGAMQGFMEAAQKVSTVPEAVPSAGQGASPSVEPKHAAPDMAEAVSADEGPAAAASEVAVVKAPVADAVAEAAEATADVVARAAAVVAKRSPRSVKAANPAEKPARARRSKAPDDLKQISGIGPKLEQVLKTLDVTRFSEIAAWDENDIARFDRELGVSGRIVRDRWVEQATVLARR